MDPPKNHSDPWDWTTEEVAQKLCSSSGLLVKAFLKPEDLKPFANALEENVIYGEVLLTGIDHTILKDELKVSAVGRRHEVLSTIKHLQKDSPKYQEWRRENNEDTDKGWASHHGSATPSTLNPQFSNHNTPIGRYFREPLQTPERQGFISAINGASNAVTNGQSPREVDSPRVDLRGPAWPNVPDRFPNSHSSEEPSRSRRKASPDLESNRRNADNSDGALRASETYVQDEVGRKRRKLQQNALQLISKPAEESSSAIDNVISGLQASKEDGPSAHQSTTTETADAHVRSGLLRGYLGSKGMPVNHIFYPNTVMNSTVYHPVYLNQTETDAIARDRNLLRLAPEPSIVISLKHRGPIGSGLKRYVNNRMKHFLLRSNAKEPTILRNKSTEMYGIKPYPKRLLRYTPAAEKYSITVFRGEVVTRVDGSQWKVVDINDHVQSDPNSLDSRLEWYVEQADDDQGEGLPLFGESDSEEEYDSDTLRELEEDHEAKERMAVTKNGIVKERVAAILDECISGYRQHWENEKLPQLQLRAWSIWTRSRRKRTAKWEIRDCDREIERLDDRLTILRTELERDAWANDEQVRKSSGNLEFTLKDLCYAKWKVQVLRERLPPPRPDRSQRRAAEKVVRPAAKPLLDDEEELTSDDDDDHLSEFIDDDEADDSAPLEVMDASTELNMEEITRQSPVPLPAIESIQKDEQRQIGKEKSPPSEDMTTADKSYGYREQSGTKDVFDRVSTPPQVAPPAKEPEPILDYTSDSLLEETADDEEVNREPVVKPAQLTSSIQIIDLTASSDDECMDPPEPPQNNQESDIDTPLKKNAVSDPSLDEAPIKTEPGTVDSDSSSIPDPRNIEAYINIKPRHLRNILKKKQPDQLLVYIICKTPAELKGNANLALQGKDSNIIVVEVFNALETLKKNSQKLRDVDEKRSRGLFQIATWFIVWTCRTIPKLEDGIDINHIEEALRVIGDQGAQFDKFYELVMSAMLWFKFNDPDKASLKSFPSSPFLLKKPEPPTSAQKKASGTSHGRKRGRPIKESQEGIDLRESAQKRAEERKERSKALQSEHLLLGTRSNQPAIINPKSDEEDFIFINPRIASLIHSHQIEGVRFLWDEIVTAKEGCLLAHTMGLGKTMQCITLLLTMAEASKSPNARIREQVPPEFQDSRILIIAPPSLLENWSEELSKWIPEPSEESVGFIRMISPSLKAMEERLYELQLWADNGGILLISYVMLESLVLNRKRNRPAPPLNDEEHEKVKHLLFDAASLVIADEAQTFKNESSIVSKVLHRIRTRSRIALTGSPLSNNLIEYFSIVNWVQESYLGGKQEFRAKFVTPITEGLYKDSTSSEKRKSLKMLEVLKRDLAPKVLRADYSVLKGQMKGKTEFLLRVPLTEIQNKCYALYIDSIHSDKLGDASSARLWAWLAILRLLCNHPSCFYAKLKEADAGSPPNEESTNEPSKKTPSGSREESLEMDAEADELLSQPVTAVGLEPTMVQKQLLELETVAGDISSIEQSHKMEILMDIIRFSQEADEKVLVFSQSLPTLDYVGQQLKKAKCGFLRLDGSLNTIKRQKFTKEFNQGKMKVLLISTRAGGTGINLQSASRVVILDDSWNPMHEQQAIGRSYRIGQLRHVYVYRLVISGSFEDALQNQTLFKLQLATRVVDKKDIVRHAQKDVRQYIMPIKQQAQEDLTPFEGKDALVLDRLLSSKASLIRSIQLAETFMEEEAEELTAEEVKEVQELSELECLRRSNPVAYGKKITERQQLSDITGRRYDNSGHVMGPVFPSPSMAANNFWNLARSQYIHPDRPPAPATPMNPQERLSEPETVRQNLMPVLGAGTHWVPQGSTLAAVVPTHEDHREMPQSKVAECTTRTRAEVPPRAESSDSGTSDSQNPFNEALKSLPKASRLQGEQNLKTVLHKAISTTQNNKDAAPLPKDARALADRCARRIQRKIYRLADSEDHYHRLLDEYPIDFEMGGEKAIRDLLEKAEKEKDEKSSRNFSTSSRRAGTRSPLISQENDDTSKADGQAEQQLSPQLPESNRPSSVSSPASSSVAGVLGNTKQSSRSQEDVGSAPNRSLSPGSSISVDFPSLQDLLKNNTNGH